MIIKSNQEEIQNYLSDSSNFKGNCEKVYFPENREQVSEILKEANEKCIPVTISGNGTGLAGGRVPKGGYVIATDKLNSIIEIDKNNLTTTVESGVILDDLLKELKSIGCLYPPDPTETNCFIGGTIATNASGAKTFKYGSTRNYVLELEVVLPTGDIVYLERGMYHANEYSLSIKTIDGKEITIEIPQFEMPNTKNASGYFCENGMDAIDLFIGSEGTLGVITKAVLKTLKEPEDLLSCVAFFPTIEDGLSFVKEARELSYISRTEQNKNDLDARALEFFDKNALTFIKDNFPQVDSNAACAVWFEQELTKDNADKLTEFWFELIVKHNGDDDSIWAGMDATDREKIRAFRHALPETVNEYIAQNNFRKLGTDVAVPHKEFDTFYQLCTSSVDEAGLHYVVYGHFGDSHMHLNMLPKTDEEWKKGKDLYQYICVEAVKRGGTVSAEHGIGKMKTDYLKMMYGEEVIQQMAKLKKSLDPKMILGRGNMIDESLL